MFPKESLLFHLQTQMHDIVLAQTPAAEGEGKQEAPLLRYLGAIYCQVHA